jgi:hypothetical protein
VGRPLTFEDAIGFVFRLPAGRPSRHLDETEVASVVSL